MSDPENASAVFDPFFKRELVFRDVAFGDAFAFFRWMADTLAASGYVHPDFYQAITEREESYPTGLATASIGVAIPHTDPVHIRKPFIAVVRPKHPIAFSPMGGGPEDEKIQATLIFVLGVMRDGLQVKVLQKLMSMFADQETMDRVLESNDEKQMLDLIKNAFTKEQAQ